MNLIVVDTRTNESYPVYGLQWNESREVVNWQSEEDITGYVGGGHWREFTMWHTLRIRL